MLTDLNKGLGTTISYGITYNHINLPTKISFTSTSKIDYAYAVEGRKLQKKVTNTSVVTTTQYNHGFQYENAALKLFPQQEGFVNKEANGTFSYLYQYKDHLGNFRVSYKDANGNGSNAATEVQ